MAAEIILSAILPVMLEKLISPAIQQLSVAFGTDEKLQKLKRILEAIQSVLVDAEERQNADKFIKIWLSDLNGLAYKAEDILEDFDFEAQRKRRSLNNTRRKVLSYCSFYKPVLTRFSLCRRLNDIIEKIEARADEIHKFNFQLNKVPQISYGRPQTHSYVDKENVIGREEDKKDIVNLLISHVVSNNKKIMVLPIVAMGGMGKTTLSQLVYSDHRVEDNFHLRMWVCVSDADFDVERLVRLIIEAATKKTCNDSNMELLQDQLREIISEKRYMIVMDDVWNENQNHWDRLKTLLDCGGEGSAVVVSTRSTVAAKMMATHTIHELKQLPEEDGWELFRRRAFVEGAEEPANLVQIGKDIMKCCGGLPLAIDTLGSMMRLKNDEVEWKAVLDSEIWKMQAAKDNILPALRLSYNHLPSHLKQCFAFCAIYPKDHEMERDTLIQLWMANGYIPSDGKGDLEAVGRDIFDELVWRSFFQNVKQDTSHYDKNFQDKNFQYGYRDIVITCKMHDLMHDLAQSIMGKECLNFAHNPKWEDIPFTARHLLVPSFPELKSSWNQPILPTIRTIVSPREYLPGTYESSFKYPSMLKSLRVLSSSHKLFDKTVSVRHLRHLRLLDLSYSNSMTELPEFICSLYNLQTLNLRGCWKVKKLPDNLTDLVNLRHLYIDECHKLVCMPRGMGRLKQLNVLTRYVVGVEAERGLEQLRDLNLSGKLVLSRIEKVSNAIDAKNMNLSSKLNLLSIGLIWVGAGSLEVFEELKPHDGLRKLEICGYGGQQFPKWMIVPQQLYNLVEIKILDCRVCKELPPLWQLPFLEMLELSRMDEVKHIICKTTWCDRDLHTILFPSLKYLSICSMANLEHWWEEDGSNVQVLYELPCLKSLKIIECNKLITLLVCLIKLQELYIQKCDGLVSLPERMQSLVDLKISKCNGLTSLLEGFIKLKTLDITECDSLVSLPKGMESLVDLKISHCNGLVSLPEGMKSLVYLDISQCNGLVSLPEGMISLLLVEISQCNGLMSLPEGMEDLFRLKISQCNGLVRLPEGMEDLVRLKISQCNGLVSLPEKMEKLIRLKISQCNGLVSLPEGMESLNRLEISQCNGLVSLPEGMKSLDHLKISQCNGLVSLPKGMESLVHLEISQCNGLTSLPMALQLRLPRLTRLIIDGHGELIRSLQFGGEYWHLIENIPWRDIRQQKQHEGKCIVISQLLSSSKYCCLC